MGDTEKIFEALELMNGSLEDAQRSLFYPEADPDRPFVIIVGAPRAGKVLAHSILCHCLDLGYVDNVVNRFWYAPLFGIRLSQDLFGERPGLGFRSTYGLTAEAWSVGAFPYFWRHWLGSYESPLEEDHVDWPGLCSLLIQMAHATGRPLVLESLAMFHHLNMLAKRLNNVLFVRLRRDLVDTGMSILKMRESYLGDRNKWVNARPSNTAQVEGLDWASQIAGQIYGIHKDLDEMTAGFDVVDVNYAQMCLDPGWMVQAVAGWLRAKGHPVGCRHVVPEPFMATSHPTNPDREALREALLAFFGEPLEEGHLS